MAMASVNQKTKEAKIGEGRGQVIQEIDEGEDKVPIMQSSSSDRTKSGEKRVPESLSLPSIIKNIPWAIGLIIGASLSQRITPIHLLALSAIFHNSSMHNPSLKAWLQPMHM